MEIIDGVLLYLAAGGIVSLLLHLFVYFSKRGSLKHPQHFDFKKPSFSGRLYDVGYIIIMLLSFVFVIPFIILELDIIFASRTIDEYDTKLYDVKRRMAERCRRCTDDGMPHPVNTYETLPGEADRIDEEFHTMSVLLARVDAEKRLRPFHAEIIGKINPYTFLPISTEADYDDYLLSFVKEQLQKQNTNVR